MWDAESKRKAILEIAEKYHIDISASYAYGDTNGDFAMLKLVGNPFVINPTRELLANIRKVKPLSNKINIIVERKDVTYRLDVNRLDLLQ